MRRTGPIREESPYERTFNKLEKGKFVLGSKYLQVQKMGEGSYSAVYAVEGELDLMPCVLKAFHGKRTGFYERALNSYLQHALENYKDVSALQLPVATIHNVQTAHADRVILQERVPHEVNANNREHMNQVQQFFTASVLNNVMMDLQPSNLRVRQDGTVVLIDFVESKDPVLVFINKACQAWIESCTTREEAVLRVQFLTAGFLNKDENYNDTWLNGLVGMT